MGFGLVTFALRDERRRLALCRRRARGERRSFFDGSEALTSVVVSIAALVEAAGTFGGLGATSLVGGAGGVGAACEVAACTAFVGAL